MYVPRYWEKETTTATTAAGYQVEAGCWGWSEHSPDEARSRALKSAQRLAAYLLGGGDDPGHYGYDERLPREEIVDEFDDDRGQPQAIVTRNAYGSLILNTRDLMFIDVDFPPKQLNIPLPAFLMKLLGQSPPANPEELIGEKIRAAARNAPHPVVASRRGEECGRHPVGGVDAVHEAARCHRREDLVERRGYAPGSSLRMTPIACVVASMAFTGLVRFT